MKRIRFWGVFWSFETVLAILNGEIGAAIFGTNLPFFFLSILALVVGGIGLVYGLFHVMYRSECRLFVWLAANALVTPALIIGAPAFVPDGTVVDAFRGSPRIRAYYEGTQGGAKATFRSNGTFDIYSWGWPGSAEYFRGTFREEEGQYICTYSSRRGEDWGDRVYRDSDTLVFESAQKGKYDMRFRIVYESDTSTR